MTYAELLKETAVKKRKAIAEINAALNGPCGFLIEAEIKKKPGMVAWYYLAEEFCKILAQHVADFIDQAGGVDTLESREIGQIYMAYEDGDPNIYDYLPIEAQLFTPEIYPKRSINN